MASIRLDTTCNLLRYISEWDPREKAHTKGGYMDGEIKIPNVKGKLRMEIQTYPADDVDPLVANIHPCLLHVVRIGKGKREQDLEPVPTYYHWKQIFEIENGIVKILNKISELDIDKDGHPRPVPTSDKITDVHGNSIVLGRKKGQLNLILLQPKQQARAKPNEATVTKVLADRLQTSKCKVQVCEEFFKKKHAKNLQRIRLKVDFYKENGDNCGSSISPQTIVNTGNKEIGSMDFYDATPHKSCVRGGRKIIMVSEYNLSKDVSPKFQVYDKCDEHRPEMDKYLIQPREFTVKNQTIIFLTPQQPKLSELRKRLHNYTIKLLGKRKGDGYTSNKMFNFRYIEHEMNQCPFCDYKVDSDELVQLEAGLKRPLPGQRKREMDRNPGSPKEKRFRVHSTDDESMSCSMSGSPACSSTYEIPMSTPDSGVSGSPAYSSTYETPMSTPDSGLSGSPAYSSTYETPISTPDSGLCGSPAYSSSYEGPMNTPDSGVNSGVESYSGDDSDFSYTSNNEHEYEYTHTWTQVQLDNLGTLTAEAKFVMAEDDVDLSKAHVTPDVQFQNTNQLMDQDIGEFVDENEVRKILGLPSQNIELEWGHHEITRPYIDDIENIEIDQLFNIEQPEEDSVLNIQTLNLVSHFDVFSDSGIDINELKSNNDPMMSQGTMPLIRRDSGFAVKATGPVVLQQRIQSDSTKKSDTVKPNGEENIAPMEKNGENKQQSKKRRIDKKQKDSKQNVEEERSCVEELPLLTIIFLAFLVIFKLIGEATFGIPHYVGIILSMAAAISMIFVKNKFVV